MEESAPQWPLDLPMSWKRMHLSGHWIYLCHGRECTSVTTGSIAENKASTTKCVSLLPFKVEGKKIIIKDCPNKLEKELAYNVSHHLTRAARCCCLGAQFCLLEEKCQSFNQRYHSC